MRLPTLPQALTVFGTLLMGAALVAAVSQLGTSGAATPAFYALAVLVAVAAGGVLIWYVEPTYTLCAALLVSPISSNWQQLGIPGAAAPDRLLLLAGLAAVIVRAPGAADRPAIRIAPVHWLMLALCTYAGVSALVVGSLFDKPTFFKLLEALGVLPFVLFVAAPVAFRTPRQRDLLLRTFVVLGAWLGLTQLFEVTHVNALVWPRYILDPNYGIHAGRGRGPFAEAVTNGYALYVCAVASAIAAWRAWPRRYPTFAAGAVAALCVAGSFMCLERSVWLGAVAGTLVGVVALRGLRRYALPLLAGMALVVAAAVILIPGLRESADKRSSNQQTIWDRKNLDRAAVNMIEQRPLLGFGWGQYKKHGADYLQQADDYPLPTYTSGLEIHNVPLGYAVDLGLVGLILWLAVLITGVGGALATRGPPDLDGWRIGLLSVATCYVIVANFVPTSVFPNLSLWLIAGVVWSGRYADADAEPDALPAAARASGGA